MTECSVVMIDLKKLPVALICIMFQLLAGSVFAAELNTRYAVISYRDESQLRDFNEELSVGKLSFYIQGTAQTFQDEVRQKIDVIITRVQAVLDMHPARLSFRIVILDTEKDVDDTYKKLYGNSSGFISFYSVGKNTVYIAVENTSLKILSHEIGHAVVENYFDVSPPRRIHEVLAQFAEKHIYD